MIISQKDYEKKRKPRQQPTLLNIWSKMSIEDVYSFIKEAYLELSKKKYLIKSFFALCGYCTPNIQETGRVIASTEMEEELEEVEGFIDEELEDQEEENQQGKHLYLECYNISYFRYER